MSHSIELFIKVYVTVGVGFTVWRLFYDIRQERRETALKVMQEHFHHESKVLRDNYVNTARERDRAYSVAQKLHDEIAKLNQEIQELKK